MDSKHLHNFIALALLSFTVLCATEKYDNFVAPSGREVSASAVQRHLPVLPRTAWPHILFEQVSNNIIVSHHARLDVQRIAPLTRILIQNIPVSDPFTNKAPYPALTRAIRVRSGKGYTFVYDPDGQRLIAAWGPALQLHPLDHYRYRGLFLNAAAQAFYAKKHSNNSSTDRVAIALTRALRNGKHHMRKQQVAGWHSASNLVLLREPQALRCERILYLNITVDYDATFEEMHKPKVSEALWGVINHVGDLFEAETCVRPVMKQRNTKVYDSTEFLPPREIEKCAHSGLCVTSSVMLSFLLKQNRNVRVQPDATFLFTGYEDSTNLAGSSYRAAACNNLRAVAWVEKGYAAVLAHELGHMLGAPHDEEGIMKPTVDLGEDLVLSPKTKASIIRFVKRDPRPWCLHRDITSLYTEDFFYKGWIRCSSSTTPFPEHHAVISDVTMASLVSDHSRDLIAIFKTESSHGTSLTLAVTINISSSEKECQLDTAFNLKGKQILDFPEHIMYPSGTFGFGIAFGNIWDMSSKDIIISDVQKSASGTKVSYKVGHEIQADGSPPSTWSPHHRIPGYSSENIICTSITLAHIRTALSNDLVVMHIEKRGQINTAFYRVGFDIMPDGSARGKWTEKYQVRGWYGRTTESVSVALYDIDMNGQPEIIISHEDRSQFMDRAFIRIGRNVNREGLVTGGWSDFIAVMDLYNAKSVQTLALDVENLGGKHPTVIAASLTLTTFATRLGLHANSELLTPQLLASCKNPLPPLESFYDGCGECYSTQNAQYCREQVALCDSKVDEVRIKGKEDTSSRGITNYATERQGRPFASDKFASNVSRMKVAMSQIHLEKRTTFCEGFHYLFMLDDVCFVIDRAQVVAEGLRQAFLNSLHEVDETVLNKTSSEIMDEDPAGTHGQYKQPITVTITINGKDSSYKNVVRLAIGKLKRSGRFRNIPWDDVRITKCCKIKCVCVLFKFPKILAGNG